MSPTKKPTTSLSPRVGDQSAEISNAATATSTLIPETERVSAGKSLSPTVEAAVATKTGEDTVPAKQAVPKKDATKTSARKKVTRKAETPSTAVPTPEIAPGTSPIAIDPINSDAPAATSSKAEKQRGSRTGTTRDSRAPSSLSTFTTPVNSLSKNPPLSGTATTTQAMRSPQPTPQNVITLYHPPTGPFPRPPAPYTPVGSPTGATVDSPRPSPAPSNASSELSEDDAYFSAVEEITRTKVRWADLQGLSVREQEQKLEKEDQKLSFEKARRLRPRIILGMEPGQAQMCWRDISHVAV